MNKKITYFMLCIPLLLAIALFFQKEPTPPSVEQMQVILAEKMKKELYLDALTLIDEQKGELPLEWLLYKAKAYEGLRQIDEAIATYENITKQFPNEKEAYARLLEWYKGDYPKKYLHTLLRYQKAFPNEDVKELREHILGFERTFIPADELFAQKNDFVIFKIDNQYGIMDNQLDIHVEAEFDFLSNYSEDTGYFAAQKNGVGFYVDDNGYKRLVPDVSYELVGFQNDHRAYAKRDGKYGYIDYQFNELTPFIYEDATSFYRGIAAVKHEGKWRLINRQFEKVSDTLYDDIIMDHDKVINTHGVIWVRLGEHWHLLDEQLNRLTTDTILSVKPFVSDEPVGVAFENGWGFVDKKGKSVTNQRYLETNSFLNHKTIVKTQEGQWVVMSDEFLFGQLIDAQFVAPLHDTGVVRVEDLDKTHYFIRLNHLSIE